MPKYLLLILLVGGSAVAILLIVMYSSRQDNDNFEEISVESYSLEEGIRWFKANRLDKPGKACIVKEDLSNSSNSARIKLQLCFLNVSNKPLLDKRHPVLIVKTNQLDEDLQSTFGNKDMVILE